MMNLITDRTSSDVDIIKSLNAAGFTNWSASEIAQYLSDIKGAYNASDLNRVEGAVLYLENLFKQYGYDNLSLNIKTDWNSSDTLTASDAKRYLNNISVLRNLIAVPATTPVVPTDMDQFTYEEANNIEKILLQLEQCVNNIVSEYFFSGELYGGEI